MGPLLQLLTPTLSPPNDREHPGCFSTAFLAFRSRDSTQRDRFLGGPGWPKWGFCFLHGFLDEAS